MVSQIQFHGEAITSLFGELASTSTSHLINENPTEEEYEDDIHPSAERLGFWRKGAQRAINFYSAPFVKFGLDIISYLVLVCLYCYVLLHFRAGKCRFLANRQISYASPSNTTNPNPVNTTSRHRRRRHQHHRRYQPPPTTTNHQPPTTNHQPPPGCIVVRTRRRCSRRP